MKALFFTGGRTAEIRSIRDPEPKEYGVVVRTLTSAVCGSDLPHYRKSAEELGVRSETVPGHEAVGIVEAVGKHVTKVRPGDRVLVYHHSGCGRCRYCRAGMPMFCRNRSTLGNHAHGCDAEFVALPQESCLPWPAELTTLQGVLTACNLGTAYSGVNKLGLATAETVAVFGLGPVGLSTVAVAAASGARVVGIDPVETRRSLAETIGAVDVLDPVRVNAVEALRELTQGEGPRSVIDCSANPQAQDQGMQAVAPRGRVLLLGANGRMEINPGRDVIRKELAILGSWVFKPAEYDEIVTWLKQSDRSIEQIVTHHFPASEAPGAVAAADSGATGKVVIDWSA